MQEWLRISILLCSFGFLKEVRPSEPFLTNYLLGDQYFNVTEEDVGLCNTVGHPAVNSCNFNPPLQVIQKVYPISTYSWMSQLVFAFLLTDLLR